MFFYYLAQLSRFSADAFHTYSLYLLIHKIRTTRSCSGLSLKTQILYLTVFVTRYSDLFYLNLNSKLKFYNSIMKIVFISMQAFIIYLIRFKYYYTHDKKADSFQILYLLVPSTILGFFLMRSMKSFTGSLIEYGWTFSVLLESVAIIPQLVLLQDTGEAEVLTSRYIFSLGMYRLLYLLGWGFKKLAKIHVDSLLVAFAFVQSLLYADFFILYYKYVFSKKGETKLPF